MTYERCMVATGCFIGIWGFCWLVSANPVVALGVFLALWGNNLVQKFRSRA